MNAWRGLVLSCAALAAAARGDDECASAAPLTLGIAVAGRTDNSAPTPGILADHCGGASERWNDEWFRFTAPFSGEYTYSLCESGFDTVLSLWNGCPDGVRRPVACNDDSVCGLTSRLSRAMVAGETLLVRVGGHDNLFGAFQVVVDAPLPPPPNDNCEDATPIGLGSVTGVTTHATIDGASSCPSYAPDVWYSFTAPSADRYTFDTCNTLGYDTVLSLLDGCGGRELACNDDAACTISSTRSSIARNLRAGETVLIRVSGFGDHTGTFVLTASTGGPPGPPPNDTCAGALPLAEGQNQPFDTTYATASGLRLSGCGSDATTMLNDLFYAYTPACTGEAILTTCGTSWDTIVAVLDRCGGRVLACNDNDERFVCDPSSGQSALRFPAVAGRTYIIAVGSTLVWRDGRGLLSVACVPPPGCRADYNDDGFVDGFDYSAFFWCFSGEACPAGRSPDFNEDGFADFFDYDAFVEAFELGC